MIITVQQYYLHRERERTGVTIKEHSYKYYTHLHNYSIHGHTFHLREKISIVNMTVNKYTYISFDREYFF